MVSISLAAIACIRSLINPVKILVGIGDVSSTKILGCRSSSRTITYSTKILTGLINDLMQAIAAKDIETITYPEVKEIAYSPSNEISEPVWQPQHNEVVSGG